MSLGGKEGSRGYLYQTFASIFEVLCQNNWDKIYIEFESKNDKVDIALERNKKIFKSIQVKSSINLFTKSSIAQWLNDLIEDDVGANEYALRLIGNLETKSSDFINALQKYQDNNYNIIDLDEKSKKALKGFNLSMIDSKIVHFDVLPYGIENLTRIMRDALNEYTSQKDLSLTFEQSNIILETLIAENYISSLCNNGIDRTSFDSKIEEHITMLSKKDAMRKVIGIISFERGTEYLSDYADINLSLIDKFDKRKLKFGYDWDTDIYPILNTFLLSNTDPKYCYQIALEVQLSIAFVCGRILDSKSRISALPSNPDPMHKTEVWNINDSFNDAFSNYIVRDERVDINEFDTALIISITRDIKDNVNEYILESNLKIGRMITLTIGAPGPSNIAIVNGNHAYYLVNKVLDALVKRTTPEKRATLHIFASAPNGFMFFLGQQSRGFGNCVLYEYDFEGKDTGTYSPSFKNLP